MSFQYRVSVFGNCEVEDWVDCSAKTLEEAHDIAYEIAIEEYESYAGLSTPDEILEKYDVTEEEAMSIYLEERESWIEYEVRNV